MAETVKQQHGAGESSDVRSLWSKFEEAQKALLDIQPEFLKLQSEVAELTTTRAALQDEVMALKDQRDTISNGVSSPGAEALDEWLSQQGVSSAADFDRQGKMNRKLWLLEQKNKELQAKIDGAEDEKREAVNVEKAIAAGLRDRIGELEGKIRERDQRIKAESKQVEMQERERGIEDIKHQGELSRLKSEIQMAHQQLEKRHLVGAQKESQIEELEMNLAELRETVQHYKAQEMEKTTPRKALQARSANIVTNEDPTTPTKQGLRPASPATSHAWSSQEHSPTTSLARRYALLEENHKALRAEYDKLRDRYQGDLKHWREYKAVERARIDLKTKKKAAKKAQEDQSVLTPKAGSSRVVREPEPAAEEARPFTVLVDDPPSQVEPGSQDLDADGYPLEAKLVSASEASQSSTQPKEPHSSAGRQHRETSVTLNGRTPDEEEGVYSDEEAHEEGAMGLPAQTNVKENEHTYLDEGTGQDDLNSRNMVMKPSEPKGSPMKQHLAEELKTTPWLGSTQVHRTITHTPEGSRSSKKHAKETIQDEVFGESQIGGLGHGFEGFGHQRTPLIRDRGSGGSTSKKRSKTLPRLKGEETNTPTAFSSKFRHPQTAELADMTPSQKTRELKRLNSMSSVAKKEYYAKYKGNGRYVAPEDLDRHVTDDYEIDKAQNEGANFAFHDVKRRKTDRRQMHGGDCECCKDYYEAIGAIPKYNQGPKWKDAESSNSMTNEEHVRDHQNKVSRHRETWKRAPTPPGFWEIGFPSTQKAAEQNALADEMVKQRAAQIKSEAAQKGGKWKKK